MSQRSSQVLLVSNDPKALDVLSAAFSNDHVALRFARAGDEVLEMLHHRPADIVLVDLEPAEAGGLELLRQLKEHPPRPHTLVIALTAANDVAGKLRAFELGVLDCLNKPLESEIPRARLHAALNTKRHYDELIRHNQELIKARTAAEASARAKTDFLAAMSHEIRTPMNGVIAMVGLLLETPMNAEQRSYLETIHTSSESLLSIINDILDFSKIEAGKMELDTCSFDLRGCLEETLDLLSAKALEKNLDLVYQLDDTIPVLVNGDSLRLRPRPHHQQKTGRDDGRKNVGRERARPGLHLSLHRQLHGRTADRGGNPSSPPHRSAYFDCGRQCRQPAHAGRTDRQVGHDSRSR